MTSVEDIEKAVEQLPPDKLEMFRDWYERFEATRFADGGTYKASPEELRGIDRGLRDAAEGRFATAEEVEATFAKYRGS
jgi:predicted transcriptional regulator